MILWLQFQLSAGLIIGLFLNWSWIECGKITSTPDKMDPIRYTLREETAAGYQIGNLLEDAGLSKRYSPDTLGLLRFRFVAENVKQFSIGLTNGIIRTMLEIDRDSSSQCRQMEVCEIHLSVVIQPVQYLQIIRVVIVIVDINDNSPTFRDSSFNLSIAESAAIGSSYVIPTAVDWDSGTFGVQRYELDSTGIASVEPKFGLQTVKKLDGSTEVSLELLGKLDREWEAEHRMRLTAFDGGIPPRSGSIDIIVTVLDSNDNKPEFSRDKYQVGIMENVPVGTVILQVQATDRDTGPSGAISYRFASHTRSAHGALFGIRNSTGILYVKSGVDHEKSSVYHLTVVAEDQGPGVKSAETTVVVHVEDINDNPPQIVLSTLNVEEGRLMGAGGDGWAGIREDSVVGSFVAHVTVSDLDDGFNGRINCSVNATSFNLIQKYTNEYQISTAVLLDRERLSRYSVTVRCQDAGATPLITESILNVKVIDVNDNPPVFSTNTYHGSLVENNFIGASILQVSASDWDEGNNAVIRYHIPRSNLTDRLSLHVDQRGVITVQDSIDREKYPSLRFTVLAIDSGTPALTGSAIVIVSIIDMNDEKPVFLRDRYVFNVSEGLSPGVTVGFVAAIDRDAEPHNSVLYSLVNALEYFTIDPRTGKILTKRSLDRESSPMYEIAVRARDGSIDTLSSTCIVTVYVTDVNDNSPVFHFPTTSNNTIYISNRFPVGSLVAIALALDDDDGPNGHVTYDVMLDGDVTTFSIDENSGRIITKRSLKDYDYKLFQISILSRDRGANPRTTSALLNIIVNKTIPFTVLPISGRESLLASFGDPLLYAVIAVVAGLVLVAASMLVALFFVRRREAMRREARKQERMQDVLKSLVRDSNPTEPVQKYQNGNCVPDTGNQDSEVSPWIQADLDDKDSDHSGDGTDSGRGGSEEGSSTGRLRYIPPPPPPTRSSLWSRPQAIRNGGHTIPDSRHRPTQAVRFYTLSATPEEEQEDDVMAEESRSVTTRGGILKIRMNSAEKLENGDISNNKYDSSSCQEMREMRTFNKLPRQEVNDRRVSIGSVKDSGCQSNIGSQSKIDSIEGDCYYIHLNKSHEYQTLPATRTTADIKQLHARPASQSIVI